MNYFKKIWYKLKEFIFKNHTNDEFVVSKEKEILKNDLNIEEIYISIENASSNKEKIDLLNKVAEYNTAKSIIEYVTEKKSENILINKSVKRLYDLYELRIEIKQHEEKRAALNYKKSQISVAEKPDTIIIEKQIENLYIIINQPAPIFKISFDAVDFNVSHFDNFLNNKSIYRNYKQRENQKVKLEESYKNQIRKQLSYLENLLVQNSLDEAKKIITSLKKSIKPGYQNELIRLTRAIEKLKEKELLLFRNQQEKLQKQQEKRVAELKLIEEHKLAKQEKQILLKNIESNKTKEKQNKLNALLNKKTNWREFQKVLQENNITSFYHFTCQQNIKSIIQNGGLYSWFYADSNGIQIPFPGGDTLSRSLDTKYGLKDYVRLSFCNNHPMQYRLNNRGVILVLLEIDLEVAYFNETQFSNINAADSNHKHGFNIENLLQVKFSATKRNYLRNDDPDFKFHQAEVLVKTWVPIEYITNLNKKVL